MPKGSHRKGFIINNDAYPIVVDIQKTVFIRHEGNPMLFYNEFHKCFTFLNMADMFTTKRANQIIKELEFGEKVCEQKLYGRKPERNMALINKVNEQIKLNNLK